MRALINLVIFCLLMAGGLLVAIALPESRAAIEDLFVRSLRIGNLSPRVPIISVSRSILLGQLCRREAAYVVVTEQQGCGWSALRLGSLKQGRGSDGRCFAAAGRNDG